ncbi:MAG: TonB-dependent receptor [Chlorobiaceae bacterium]|nr:TonB-dependent receptor [Chlorobiaceae bacterium]MBA4310377.1 TonB-dependent receptor [Chlorobiaceae bacterium]
MKKYITLYFFLFSFVSLLAQSGKISGTVVDASNGEPLIGASVLIEGTRLGAMANLEGFFVILNVPPGTYNVRASMVGYAPLSKLDVRVSINQTSSIEFRLRDQSIQTNEVLIIAEVPVVQKDVSASTINFNAAQIQNLPTTSVTTAVTLQAGIQGGLVVRGGGADQTAFMLNGLTLRDERNNEPYTAISLTSVEEIQVQTGGFNAEYGNIRSGLVNIVTREGKTDRYNFSIIGRYGPPQRSHFGQPANSRNSYWVRPYLDDEVAWTGTTNGAWDDYIQRQYPRFEGWNSISLKSLQDEDPNNDLTPQAAQRLWLWQHRKGLDVRHPDYDYDMSFSGPVPVISEQLGNLRFLMSFRTLKQMYIIPLSRDSYNDWSGQIKITSDVGSGMKLSFDGLYGIQSGTNDNNTGLPGIFSSDGEIANVMNRVSFIDTRIFASDYWAPSEIKRSMFGAKFTHAVSGSTFYEVIASRFSSHYSTNPGRLRDTTKIFNVGGNYWVDESPFGFYPFPSTGIDGMRMGVGMSNSRDSSEIDVYTLRFDYTTQLDQYNNLKAGAEFILTDSRTNYGSVDIFLPSGRSNSKWNSTPTRGALYVQNKLEFEGMIANLGVRMDYSHAGGDWFVYDEFTRAFAAEYSLGIDTLLEKAPTDRILTFSPRLGVAFPITVSSKLYFNYGHFRSMPQPENLYMIRRFSDNNAVTRIANPNNPLPKTVAYELGYEQSLFDNYLLRVAGYYKSMSSQTNLVTFTSRDNKVNYSVSQPNSYGDIRGFEITLSKNRGDWVQGFLNYTYMVSTSGFFGLGQYYENPADQRNYERVTLFNVQNRPIPAPYGRANIDFFTPMEFGPEIGGIYLLEDIRLNLVGSWSSGFYFTWVGGGSQPGIQNNVQWKDYYNIDMRIAKNFKFGKANFQFFVDVSNVMNHKHMSQYGFVNALDYEAYMKSLQLPDEIGNKIASYINIPGSDRPGEYRRGGTFTPMEAVGDIRNVAISQIRPTAIYWDKLSNGFYQYVNGAWAAVERSRIDEIMKNKSYIDMPNQDFFTFLNARQVYFGIKFSFELF